MVSRWAIAVFAVFFSTYEAAAGSAQGTPCVTHKRSRQGPKKPSTRR